MKKFRDCGENSVYILNPCIRYGDPKVEMYIYRYYLDNIPNQERLRADSLVSSSLETSQSEFASRWILLIYLCGIEMFTVMSLVS